jgi:hypothetical protein
MRGWLWEQGGDGPVETCGGGGGDYAFIAPWVESHMAMIGRCHCKKNMSPELRRQRW